MTISEFSQERISSAHIMVVGCGALGNEVLKNLALSGVRHLVVVDFDVVEPDNLSHSVLFTADDAVAARRKVDAACERLPRFSPDIEIMPIFGDIAYDVGVGLIMEMDVVIGCVDNRWARYCINRHCMRAGIPWVDGGIDTLEGTARVFVPGQNCYACNLGPEGLRDLAYRMPCAGTVKRNIAAGKAPTTSITASVIAAVQVQEALKLLHPQALAEGRFTSLVGKMFCYEGQHLSTRTVAFKAYDDDCAVHEQWTPVARTPLTPANTVAETLAWLNREMNMEQPSIMLCDDCFVDYVALRSDNTETSVMCPGRSVADAVARHEQLRHVPLSGIYQHEYREISRLFPYQQLTLAQLGIPGRAVLSVSSAGGEHYIELSGV